MKLDDDDGHGDGIVEFWCVVAILLIVILTSVGFLTLYMKGAIL